MKRKIKDIEIEYEIIFKPTNKHTYFKYKDGILYIVLRTKNDLQYVEKMFKTDESRIYNFLKKSMSVKKSVDEIHFFGKAYKIKIVDDYEYKIEIKGSNFIIHCHVPTERFIKQLITEFYARELKEYLKEILPIAIRDFSDVYKSVPNISYVDVNTYFGKCWIKKNLILLNIKLAKYEKKYIKSVLYHEFCHFKYANHGIGFYNLYEEKYPNAKKIQHELRMIKYNDSY